VEGDIFVTSEDSTTLPQIYWRLNSSAKMIKANWWALALAFCSTSSHHRGTCIHRALNGFGRCFRLRRADGASGIGIVSTAIRLPCRTM
jgi:hypothetical protein